MKRNKKESNKPVGVILVHEGFSPAVISFDVFILKDFINKYKDLKQSFYLVNCQISKKWLKDNPDYVYIGSEDLGHVEYINENILEFILFDLVKQKGFEMIRWEAISKGSIPKKNKMEE